MQYFAPFYNSAKTKDLFSINSNKNGYIILLNLIKRGTIAFLV